MRINKKFNLEQPDSGHRPPEHRQVSFPTLLIVWNWLRRNSFIFVGVTTLQRTKQWKHYFHVEI